ncbi:MAG: transcription antitermination factor NusB [Eubacteriales bacterium]|nr:transcription antitermination factor NusB [Eubacteriales bacterium]
MTRSEIREQALRFLYQLAVQEGDSDQQEERFLSYNDFTESDLKFFHKLVEGVTQHSAELDQEITPALVDWKFDRLPLLDQNILRMAWFEIKYSEDVPAAVAISEAVQLAKLYSDEGAHSYINAVLGSLYRQHEAKE